MHHDKHDDDNRCAFNDNIDYVCANYHHNHDDHDNHNNDHDDRSTWISDIHKFGYLDLSARS
jgi:hypothetical protein